MEDIILVGSGGCMRELLWQILEGQDDVRWNVIGYVDNEKPERNDICYVGGKCCPYLGDDAWLLMQKKEVNVAICVGSPRLRKKIALKLQENHYLKFPSLILGTAQVCSDIQIGCGCIISTGSCISTNVRLGNFVFVNIGAMVHHDGSIGDFVTVSPGAALAGAVKVQEMSDIGMGAHIIQGIQIGKGVTVGAGSVVIRDIDDNCTAVGVPARIL